jgi:putative NADPH-quinone reductase
MASAKRVLILFAHPSLHRSEANKLLFDASHQVDHVTLVDLYQEYPTYHIHIEREQQRLRDHDVIVFMFPMYWYSTPSILKEWQDLVLEHGFAYGHEGTELQGKQFICAITAGGPAKAYHAGGYKHFTMRELLQPLEQVAEITGMHYLPPYALLGARTAKDEGRMSGHISGWKKLLTHLTQEHIDPEKLANANTINSYVDALEEKPV